jgi:hypothetical protein
MRAPDFAFGVAGLHRLIFFFATPDGTPIAFVTSWKSGEREGRSLSQKMLLLLVQDRARFLRASAMFLSLPLLLLLVLLLFWVLDKQKHST